MLSVVLLCCALLPTDEPARSDGEPAQSKLAAYQEAATKAGRDANAHVKLALWCEAHGLTAERLEHLVLATLINPSHATARGLLGLMANGDKWLRPEEVKNQLASDPKAQAVLQEYLQRRAATPDKPEAQWKLAQWCDQVGLADQALAHYSTVVRLDPRREVAWKRLGYKKSGDRWVKPDQLVAERSAAEHQRFATRHWKPILERYHDGLKSENAAKRTQAEAGLAAMTDSWAVPAVWEVFVKGDERSQFTAIQVLGQIDAAAASRALAAIAVFAPSAAVRGRAIETAVRHDPGIISPRSWT